MSVTNDNNKPISDCESESSHRDYKPGHFYDGNDTGTAGERLGGEGSMGLLYDQGAIRCAYVPDIEMMGLSKDSTEKVVPQNKQGSAAHLKA